LIVVGEAGADDLDFCSASCGAGVRGYFADHWRR
jgi:hypothetical protein